VLNAPAPAGVLDAIFGDTTRLSPNSTTPLALMVVICMGPKIFAGIGFILSLQFSSIYAFIPVLVLLCRYCPNTKDAMEQNKPNHIHYSIIWQRKLTKMGFDRGKVEIEEITGGIVNFDGALVISPKGSSKTVLGAGSENTALFTFTFTGTSFTNSISGNLLDQPISGNI
jgi:spore germination protein PF